MTYKEIKERLTQCEMSLKQIKIASEKTPKSSAQAVKVQQAVKTINEQISKYKKMLKEAEKTYLITPKGGKPTAASMSDDEVEGLKDADDVDSIKGVDGEQIKEQVDFDLEQTKLIAKKVGEAVYKGLKSLGDEVKTMKAVNIEDSSFEIQVQYKGGDVNVDEFSFYINGDKLTLIDFSFKKEVGEIGQKPSGEPIVQVDVIANALVKHWSSIKNEEVNEAPEGMFYIKVSVRDARKALAMIDDQPALKHEVEISGSDTYYLNDESLAYDLMMDFNANDIEVIDTNIDEDNLEEYKSDYAKRRAAERDYQPSKKDKPAKAYKEPSNDYFARRKAEMDEALDPKEWFANRHKGHREALLQWIEKDERSKGKRIIDLDHVKFEIIDAWLKDYRFGRNIESYLDSKESRDGFWRATQAQAAGKLNETDNVDAEMDGGDLDVGHQDDEPNMLKKEIYDIITYAAKLYRQLDKYDKHDGEVDFPQWWQKKVILARSYMSAAQHYLEGEEKQPAIDQLALEGKEAEGQMAATKGKKYSENPYKKGTKDHLEWSKGHNQARASKSSMSEESISTHDPSLAKGILDMVELHAATAGLTDQDAAKEVVEFIQKNFSTANEGTLEEGTDLYDRNGIHIKRFSGGQKGVMVQITIGDKYIVIPAGEYPFLVRAMQSVQDDLKDMTRQYPRAKNMDEASIGKIQKAHGLVVAKMKELAKVYKSGDHSVIDQLRELTAQKKKLEHSLEKAVGNFGADQNIDGFDGYSDLDENQDIPDVTDMSVVSGGKRYVDMEDMEGEIEIEPGMLVSVKGKTYKVTDIEKGDNYLIVPVEQEQVQEEKATYCGACGKTHKKSQSCPK